MYADHLVARFDGTCRGDGRIDATAHRSEYSHEDQTSAAVVVVSVVAGRTLLRIPERPACRARRTTPPISAARAATSSPVVVCPSENRKEPRADAASVPIASNTWLGSATPAVHADPVEHSIPRASSSMSRLSPAHPGKVKCAFPWSRCDALP